MSIAVVFGTRPEAIKMAPVIAMLKKQELPFTVISTGQHREMVKPILDWFEIKVDQELDIMQRNQSLAQLSTSCLEALDRTFNQKKPRVVVVQGDTTTAFVAALAAFYNKIPVAHVEAGLRTHNKLSPWPEEVNRNLVSKIADLHFAPTPAARTNLHKENIDEAAINITGNTVIDALLFSVDKVVAKKVFPSSLKDFFTGPLVQNRVVLVTGHRRENFGEGFASICRAIRKLAMLYRDVYFIYPVHLNPNVQAAVLPMLSGIANVRLIDPLGYAEFVSLMKRSHLILTDSGGVQEEAPSLGKPVLLMRENTERPEGVEAGAVRLVGTGEDSIVNTTQLLLNDSEVYQRMAQVKNPYGDGRAAERIVAALTAMKQ